MKHHFQLHNAYATLQYFANSEFFVVPTSEIAGMQTRAQKNGTNYILNGNKMWSTNGAIAQVAIIWAKL